MSAAAAVLFPFALFAADTTAPAEIEPAPFLATFVFDPELAELLLEAEAATAFVGRAAATSFPINLGFFAVEGGGACFQYMPQQRTEQNRNADG